MDIYLTDSFVIIWLILLLTTFFLISIRTGRRLPFWFAVAYSTALASSFARDLMHYGNFLWDGDVAILTWPLSCAVYSLPPIFSAKWFSNDPIGVFRFIVVMCGTVYSSIIFLFLNWLLHALSKHRRMAAGARVPL